MLCTAVLADSAAFCSNFLAMSICGSLGGWIGSWIGDAIAGIASLI